MYTTVQILALIKKIENWIWDKHGLSSTTCATCWGWAREAPDCGLTSVCCTCLVLWLVISSIAVEGKPPSITVHLLPQSPYPASCYPFGCVVVFWSAMRRFNQSLWISLLCSGIVTAPSQRPSIGTWRVGVAYWACNWGGLLKLLPNVSSLFGFTADH